MAEGLGTFYGGGGNCAEAEHKNRNLVRRAAVAAEVLTAHRGLAFDERAFAQPRFENAIDARHQLGVVVRGGDEFILDRKSTRLNSSH